MVAADVQLYLVDLLGKSMQFRAHSQSPLGLDALREVSRISASVLGPMRGGANAKGRVHFVRVVSDGDGGHVDVSEDQ